MFSITLAAAIMTLSCEKETWNDLSVSGQGDTNTRSLELDAFSRIELHGVANLYVSSGDQQAVTLEAQKNIMEVLTWKVSGHTLSIGLKPGGRYLPGWGSPGGIIHRLQGNRRVKRL